MLAANLQTENFKITRQGLSGEEQALLRWKGILPLRVYGQPRTIGQVLATIEGRIEGRLL